MLLNKELVEKFQSQYLKKCGVLISYSTAEAQLKDLAELIRLTSRKVQQS